MSRRGRPSKWQRGPDGALLVDANGNLIPIRDGIQAQKYKPREGREVRQAEPERPERPARAPDEAEALEEYLQDVMGDEFEADDPAELARNLPDLVRKDVANKPKADGILRHSYSSVAEACDAALRGSPANPKNQPVLDGWRKQKTGRWYGLDTPMDISELSSLVRGGWAAGARKLFDTAGKITAPRVESLTRKSEWRDQGEELNLDKLYSGEIDTMWRGFKPQIKKSGRSRVVKIVYGLACSADQSAESLFWSGACAAVLSDALVKAGYSVAVDGLIHGSLDREKFEISIKIKGSESLMSVASLAGVTCLAGFFRGIGHCLTTQIISKQIGNVGFSPKYKAPDNLEAGSIYISPNVARDQASAIQWLNSTLEAFA